MYNVLDVFCCTYIHVLLFSYNLKVFINSQRTLTADLKLSKTKHSMPPTSAKSTCMLSNNEFMSYSFLFVGFDNIQWQMAEKIACSCR